MNIIPKPLQFKVHNGAVSFCGQTVFGGDFPQTAAFARKLTADRSGSANRIDFRKDAALAEEEYAVRCDDDGAVVTASTERGAFRGLMTLEQMSAGGGSFPAAEISDRPQYAHRGFMLDSARHFQTVEKIKQILDVMAVLKYNVFHWHLTDDQGWRAEIKKYPLLTEKGAIRKSTQLSLTGYFQGKELHDDEEYGRGLYYTQENMREIVAYAAERQIDVIPEVDMPGHQVAAIACYPEISCRGEATEVSDRWGVMDNIVCCGNEKNFLFLQDIVDELCEIFPYKYFHIGGDEVPKGRWEKCPACQAKIKELGLKNENELQAYFNNRMADYLKTKGKSLIAWNEILDGAAVLDKETVAQWWIKRLGKGNQELDWMRGGGKVILSLVNYVYMDHAYAVRPLSKTYAYRAETMGITDRTNVLGMEIPQWTEYIRTEEKFDLNTYARLIAFAEVCWSADELKNYADFEARLEAMRPYFERFGLRIAPQKIYRGKTTKWYVLGAAGKWAKWRNDPNFEVAAARKVRGE